MEERTLGFAGDAKSGRKEGRRGNREKGREREREWDVLQCKAGGERGRRGDGRTNVRPVIRWGVGIRPSVANREPRMRTARGQFYTPFARENLSNAFGQFYIISRRIRPILCEIRGDTWNFLSFITLIIYDISAHVIKRNLRNRIFWYNYFVKAFV